MTEDPFSTQGWNRYSYVGNSPLNFTDPTGYCFLGCFWKPIFKAIGNFFKQSFAAIIQVAATALLCSGPTAPICAGVIAFAVTGVTSGDLGLALRAGATAFFAAAAMNAVGTATLGEGHPMPAFMSPAHVANMAGHALVGCASAVMGGGKCGPGALAGAAGSLAAPAIGRTFPNPRTDASDLFGGTVASAVVGGIASTAGGGKFANGAATAAFGYLFNATNNVGASAHAPGWAMAALGKVLEWITGDQYVWVPTGLSGGVVYQYPDPTVPGEAGIPRDIGIYGQVHWELIGKPSSIKLSLSADWGTGSGTIQETFAGDTTTVSGMVNGLGASATYSTDGKLIGLGLQGGQGLGGGWTWDKTGTATIGDYWK